MKSLIKTLALVSCFTPSVVFSMGYEKEGSRGALRPGQPYQEERGSGSSRYSYGYHSEPNASQSYGGGYDYHSEPNASQGYGGGYDYHSEPNASQGYGGGYSYHSH